MMKWLGWILAICLLLATGGAYVLGQRRIHAEERRINERITRERAEGEDVLSRLEQDESVPSERMATEKSRVQQLETQLAALGKTKNQLEERLRELKNQTEALRDQLADRTEIDKEHQERIRELQSRRAQVLREVTLLRQAVAMVTREAGS